MGLLKRIPFALALSGGTARSVAHVGIIKALVEQGISIEHIAGTSGGSIVAALFASGMPISTMEELAREMSWKKLMSLKLSRLGFISSERIERYIIELVGDLSFQDLKIPCYIIATDLETGDKKVFREGRVALAVRASCSIPQIYLPVEVDGKSYVDGGISEYLGIETLREQAGRVFAVGSHLAPVSKKYRRPRHIVQLIMQMTGLMARKNYVISAKKADFLIHPDLGEFSPFDFDGAPALMDIAYEETKRIIPTMLDEWRRKSSFLGRINQYFIGHS